MTRKNIRFRLAPRKKTKPSFTFADICSGIGGMRLAFENLGGRCVFSSEIDRYCKETYSANFGEIPQDDLMKIPIDKIPKHDLMLAGFPCQPFSKGGFATRRKLERKDGFKDDSQGKIFFRIAKIISEKKPKVVFLENVPRIVLYNNGEIISIIVKRLEKLGYNVSYKIINSDTVVPQRRERLYIVALLGKSEFSFPEIPDLKPKLENILEKRTDKKYVLSDKLWSWLQNHAKKHERKGNGFGFRMAHPKKTACTLSARYGKDGSEILIPGKNGNPRKLSPRECARLMGFSDEFKIPVSDTQAYKQFGNSVIVPIVYIIGNKIIQYHNINKNLKLSIPLKIC